MYYPRFILFLFHCSKNTLKAFFLLLILCAKRTPYYGENGVTFKKESRSEQSIQSHNKENHKSVLSRDVSDTKET